jgi:polyisoprenoid-binding protein YceI
MPEEAPVTIAQDTTRSLVPAGAWRVDPARSWITWELNGEKVHNGQFSEFQATVTPSQITGVVQAGTVEADQEGLTQHLRSPDYFGADRYPEIHFESTSIEYSGADAFEIRGLLTIAEAAQEVELSARADKTPRVRASGEVSLGDVTVQVLVDAVLERA